MVPDTFTIPKAQYFRLKTQRLLFGFDVFSTILRLTSKNPAQVNEYLSNSLLYERLTTTLITKATSHFPQMS